MTADKGTLGLTEGSLELLAEAHNQPDWLRERRRAAWQVYTATPAPTLRDEEWRRTDIRWVRWDELQVSADGQTPRAVPATVPLQSLEPSAIIVQVDGASAVLHLSDEARDAGVVAMGLSDAARERPELVRDHLSMRAVTPGRGKLQALNAALWSGGALVHVPRGVRLGKPIVFAVQAESASSVCPHTLVRLEEGAAASVVEWWTSPEAGGLSFANGAAELLVGPGAQLAYTHVQAWGSKVGGFMSQHALLDRDANLTTTNVALGGRFHKGRLDTTIEGRGASALMNGLYYLTGQQFVDHHTLQDHIATDAASDLLFVGALDGKSRSVYAGTIIVEPQAQRSNAYQNNRNLMLHSGPRADSIPRLEIMADDVRCTHGATTSTVDPGQMFYLQSRGLTAEQSRSLITQGFFQPVLDRIGDPALRDVLRRAVQEKVAAAGGKAGD